MLTWSVLPAPPPTEAVGMTLVLRPDHIDVVQPL